MDNFGSHIKANKSHTGQQVIPGLYKNVLAMVYASYISIKYPAIFWYLEARKHPAAFLVSWMQSQGQQAGGGYHPAAIARNIGAIEVRAHNWYASYQTCFFLKHNGGNKKNTCSSCLQWQCFLELLPDIFLLLEKYRNWLLKSEEKYKTLLNKSLDETI